MVYKIPMVKGLVTHWTGYISHLLVHRHYMPEHILSIGEASGTYGASVVPHVLMYVAYVTLEAVLFYEGFRTVRTFVVSFVVMHGFNVALEMVGAGEVRRALVALEGLLRGVRVVERGVLA